MITAKVKHLYFVQILECNWEKNVVQYFLNKSRKMIFPKSKTRR